MTGPLERLGLVAPRYDQESLSAVLPAAAGALGIDLATRDGLSSRAARNALGLPDATRVCVVLVDGLGARLLSERAGHAPNLRRLLPHSREITVGFPSTTATSLGSFGTGSGPGRTGMLGYTVRSTLTGDLGNMVSWTGLDEPEDVQRERTVFSLLAAKGVEVNSVGPRRFAGSGLTRAALAGAQYRAVESLSDRVDVAAHELMAPGLVYLYWGEVDKVGHHYGWSSPQWGDALSEFDREFGRLLRALPRDTLVVVTADHGMVDTDSNRWDIAQNPSLREGISLVAGEPRATHLFCSPDVSPRDVVTRWESVLGDSAVVLTGAQAAELGWFGPVSGHVEQTIPDVVVAATGRTTIVDSASQTPASIALTGVHGSLTPQEMYVPLITAVT